MVKSTVKRSWEQFCFVKCFRVFNFWRKPNLHLLILLGKVDRRNRGTHSPDWHISKISQEITSASSTGAEEPALCSSPKPGSTVLSCGAISAPGAAQSCGRRTPLAVHCSPCTFLLHASLSQSPCQAHLLLLANKSSDTDTNCGQMKIWGICLESGILPIQQMSGFSMSEQLSLHTQAQIIMVLRKSRQHTEMLSLFFRDKIFLLALSAGEDSQLLSVCSLQLLLPLSHLQHHSLTLALHREHHHAALPPLLLTPLFQSALDHPLEQQG